MTTQEQNFLIALLNLSKKIQANDMTVIDDITVINTYADITEDDELQIESTLTIECDEATAVNKDLLTTVVNSFSFVDKNFLLENLAYAVLDKSNQSLIKSYLDQALTETIAFIRSRNEFLYYTRLVNICIGCRDTELTSRAINKLQSIQPV